MSKIGANWNKGRYVKIGVFKLLAGLGAVLGKLSPSKTDEISEKFQRGGGVIFNPKIYIAKFGSLNRAI